MFTKVETIVEYNISLTLLDLSVTNAAVEQLIN